MRIAIVWLLLALGACTSPGLNPNLLHDFTHLVSEDGTTITLEGSNVAHHPSTMKPLLIKRAAELAEARGAKSMRVVRADAWFHGGPGDIWLARATIELSPLALPEIQSVQYSVSRAKSNALFSSVSDPHIPTGRIAGTLTTHANGSRVMATPVFIDTVSTLWKWGDLYVTDEVALVEPGLQRFLVNVRIHPRGLWYGWHQESIFFAVTVRPDVTYVVRSSVEGDGVDVWIDDPGTPGQRVGAVRLPLNQ